MLGKSFGKPQGFGIGLHHAKTTIESWNGKLAIQIRIGQGTIVQVYLPKAQPPTWFISQIPLLHEQTIVIADDHEAIHMIWKKELNKLAQEQVSRLLANVSVQEIINSEQLGTYI